MNLPNFAVRRPLTIIMVFAAIFLFGTISLSKLGIDFLPEIEPPAISVLVPYPGASAADVENDITKYLEDQLSTVNNLDKLRSLSKDNLSMVTCQFQWGTNLDVASNDIRDKVDLAKPDIHEHAPSAEEPMLYKFSSATAPIMAITINASESRKQLFHIVDKQICDALKRINGVGAIMIYGGLRRQINIQFDWQKLEAYNLNPQVIIDALKQDNIDMPSGDIKMGRRKYFIRVAGKFDSTQEIGEVIIGSSNGKPVYIKDVAQVSDSFEEQMMKAWGNEKEGLVLLIQKQSGANTVEVCRSVRDFLKKKKTDLPSDFEIAIPMDNSEFILHSIRNLSQTLVLAGLLVILITLFFIRKILASLIVALTIPFSLIIAFIFLYANGFTINIISLMSLAIAIGLVVDNTVVVLENITRHIDEGQKPREAAVFASNEVGAAITASTLTTIAVLIPLVFVTGLAGIIFKQLGFILSITLAGSLFVALTVTPMLSSRWIKPFNQNQGNEPASKFFLWGERVLRRVEAIYENILEHALLHKKKILVFLIMIFVLSLILIKFIGSDLFPEVDTGDIRVNFSLSENARLKETEKAALEMARFYEEFVPETDNYYSFIGETKKGIGVAMGMDEGANIGQSGVKLISKGKRNRSALEIANLLREKAKSIPGIEKISIFATTPIKQMLMGGAKKIEVEIFGHDMKITSELAEKIKRIMEETRGAIDIRISRKKPRFEIWVKVDREKAAQMGVSVASIASVLRSNYYGFDASKYRDNGDDFSIFVQLSKREKNTVDTIGDISIPSISGSLIKLKNIAKITDALGPVEIERKNRERVVKVGCDVYKRSLGEVKRDIEKKMARLDLPPGITMDFAGEVEEQGKAFSDLLLLLCVGIILVYMVMAAQFESLKTPFIIFFSIPFAFIGVAWALFITNTSLNLMSFMALIMLMGVVVNGAIVLVDYTNILRARGLSVLEAVKQAGKHRLRPVLMSAFSTVFGMLPLAFFRGQGAEMWQPFGIAAMGGLLVATLVTLVLVPVIYTLVHKEKGGRIG
ncbi:MAG: efflux RND transporter permease subunit [Candidatus Omnitrophica bacterium]|nr:efflux RND transporter permease subunit [Candidatus Omnitrophota bacterium]